MGQVARATMTITMIERASQRNEPQLSITHRGSRTNRAERGIGYHTIASHRIASSGTGRSVSPRSRLRRQTRQTHPTLSRSRSQGQNLSEYSSYEYIECIEGAGPAWLPGCLYHVPLMDTADSLPTHYLQVSSSSSSSAPSITPSISSFPCVSACNSCSPPRRRSDPVIHVIHLNEARPRTGCHDLVRA